MKAAGLLGHLSNYELFGRYRLGDRTILKRFARLRGQLRAQGQLIGDLDLLIAATALYYDLTLVTHNTRHFSRITDLKLYQPS